MIHPTSKLKISVLFLLILYATFFPFLSFFIPYIEIIISE